jgi:hypothetical protein
MNRSTLVITLLCALSLTEVVGHAVRIDVADRNAMRVRRRLPYAEEEKESTLSSSP